MRISDLFRLCTANLWKRKVRTLLTVLGVVIGTSSIVVMISLGVGLEEAQREMISQWMDITTIEVYGNYGGGIRKEGGGGGEQQTTLNELAVEAFRSIPNVVAVTPILNMYSDDPEWSEVVMTSGRYTFSGQLIGMDLTMMESLGYTLLDGRWPTPGDDNVILFGETAGYNFVDKNSSSPYPMVPEPDENGERPAPKVNPMTGRIFIRPGFRTMDDNGNPVTSIPDIKDYRVAVTGVIKGDYQKDYGSSFNSAYIDYRFVVKLREEYNKLNNIKTTNTGFDNVRIKVNDMKNVAAAEKMVQDMGFNTYSFEQIRQQMEDQMRNIQLVLGALGAVSMLVAALGIANTMVMSIYERTREIGVMKVVGCRLRDIRSMFLVEAGTIGLLGGFAGLALSYGLSFAINKVMGGSMFGSNSAISVIPLWLVVLGFTFSIAVGILSGLYPAQRAVKISALAAIRQD